MTRPADPSGRRPRDLDVPVAPVATAGRRSGRGGVAVLLVAGALGLVVAVGVVGRTREADRTLGESLAPVASPVALRPTESPSAPSPTPAGTSRSERPETLPVLPDVVLPDAPTAAFHERRDDDLLIRAWRPTDDEISPVRPLLTVAGAFEGFGRQTPTVVIAAPAGDALVVRGLGSFSGGPGDRVRLVREGGRELWVRDDGDGFPVAPVWSPDGRLVVVPGPAGNWRVLEVAGDEVTEVTVAESWQPDGPAGPVRVVSRDTLEPVGFSEDGRWLYTVQRRSDDRSVRVAARFGIDQPAYEPIHRIPTDGPDALSATGRLGYDSDPLTGRRYSSPGLMLSTGPTDIPVVEAHGAPAFTVKLDAVVGLAWTGDGRLLALEVDQVPEPSQLRLLPIDGTGTVGEPLLESGPISWATLVGVRDGHALIALATSGWDGEAILVMLRLADGATATMPLSLWLFSELQVGGWLNEAE